MFEDGVGRPPITAAGNAVLFDTVLGTAMHRLPLSVVRKAPGGSDGDMAAMVAPFSFSVPRPLVGPQFPWPLSFLLAS